MNKIIKKSLFRVSTLSINYKYVPLIGEIRKSNEVGSNQFEGVERYQKDQSSLCVKKTHVLYIYIYL